MAHIFFHIIIQNVTTIVIRDICLDANVQLVQPFPVLHDYVNCRICKWWIFYKLWLFQKSSDITDNSIIDNRMYSTEVEDGRST